MGTKITKRMLKKLIKEELNKVLLNERFPDFSQKVQVAGKSLPVLGFMKQADELRGRIAKIPGLSSAASVQGAPVLLLPGPGGSILGAGFPGGKNDVNSAKSWRDLINRANIIEGDNVVDEAWVNQNVNIEKTRFDLPMGDDLE